MARQILGEDKIIGISTHSIEQARQAEKKGADYLAMGPIFATPSKPEAGPPKGTKIISRIKEVVRIPVVAIGGIDLDNAEETLKAGADGVAVISAIFKERDVGLAIRKLSQKIQAVQNAYHTNRKS
ncbi:Thiamine-phosphate synthase [subsurface metagenome]